MICIKRVFINVSNQNMSYTRNSIDAVQNVELNVLY